MPTIEHLQRFYDLLKGLAHHVGGTRKLGDCDGRMNWPNRGVYFFFERGEARSDSGVGPRVVRVGTHALKPGSRTSLWSRLSQHRGPLKTGGGNHRGSIFRLIVGSALIRREGWDCKSWGVGSHPRAAAKRLEVNVDDVLSSELPIEQAVSQYVRAMTFLWVSVEDDPGANSRRGIIERNAIAMLSNYSRRAVDLPSKEWLGWDSDRDLARQSGLWNNNHVQDAYDSGFLETLQAAVAKTQVA